MKKKINSEMISEIMVYSVVLMILVAVSYYFHTIKSYGWLILFLLPIAYFIFKIAYVSRIVKTDVDDKIVNARLGIGFIFPVILVFNLISLELFILANIVLCITIVSVIYRIVFSTLDPIDEFYDKNPEYKNIPGYKGQLKYAYKMVNITHKSYEEGTKISYMYILYGMGYANLPSPNNKKHDFKLAIDAIHIYHENNSNRGVSEAYQSNVIQAADICISKKGFKNVIDFLFYEIEKKKNQSNTLDFDFENVLQHLEERLLVLKKMIEDEEENDDSTKTILKEDFENGFEKWFYQQKEEIKVQLANLNN